jgi:predicted GTPase
VRLALSLDPGAIILEGSGASLPPVAADRTVCVTRGGGEAVSGLGPLRLLRSDLVILLGDPDAEVPHDRVIRCKLEPEPVEAVPEGTRAAVFTTARPEEAGRFRAALEQKGIEVALLSANLARRGELQRDLAEATRARCDLFLTELKAAAIDMVVERAERDGLPVVWLRNRVVSLPGEPDLDRELWRLFDEIPRTATAAAVKT